MRTKHLMMFTDFVPPESFAARLERERQMARVQLFEGPPVTLDGSARDDLCVAALINAISDQDLKAKETR